MCGKLHQKGWCVKAIAFLMFSLAVAGSAAHGQARPPWWDGRWGYRKLLTVSPAPSGLGAKVWIHIRPGADHGGKDIRVIGPGEQPVPFGIMHAAPEGRYLLAFEARPQRGFYAVYYDNPRAGVITADPPPAGLIYETRPIPEKADASSWIAARATLDRAGPASGAAYWRRVFDAYNPFGPQSDYIATYRGHVRCPTAGHYRFATVSTHSSFLLVDDQLVTQWVGWHNIHKGRRGEHSGTIYLDKGPHRFLYVHFAYGRGGRSAAAWMPPDTNRWHVIPEGAFAGMRRAQVYECERYGQPVCADFTLAPESYCEAGAAKMVAVRFASKSSTATDALMDRYLWDFGDGQVSHDSRPRHVFLGLGTYTVTLSITTTAGERTACTKTGRISPIWNDLDFRRPKLQRFYQEVRNYRLEALPTPSLLAAWELFKHVEQQGKASEAALLLDKRRTDLKPTELYEVAMDVARYYQASDPRPVQAEQYFELAFQTAPESDRLRRFNARLALCDHYFYHMEQPEKARREYEKVRADFPQTNPERRRLALIRIGDTYRTQGKAEAALERYREAEDEPAYLPDKPRALVVGSAFQQAESYLRQGKADDALERLEKLLWQYPTMRLEGQPTLVHLRANLLRGNFEEAKKEADIFIGFSKDPNWLPAVHIQAAEACIELGLMEEAASHYRTVLSDFPESPEVEEANSGLRRLGE